MQLVDLVRAGVVQLIALQIDLGPTEVIGQTLGVEERARPADIMLEVIIEFGLEFGVGLAGRIGLLDSRIRGMSVSATNRPP